MVVLAGVVYHFFLIQTKIREKVQFKGLAKGGEPHDGPKLQNRV